MKSPSWLFSIKIINNYTFKTIQDNTKIFYCLKSFKTKLVIWGLVDTPANLWQDGDKFWRMPECYIRGSTIKYLRIPDEIIDMVKEEVVSKGRGRGGAQQNKQQGKGRGGAGRGEWKCFLQFRLLQTFCLCLLSQHQYWYWSIEKNLKVL